MSDQFLLTAYQEICKKHSGLDDFRMKLLGLLPIASVVGLFTLNQSGGIAIEGPANEIVTYVGVFAGLFTLSLFIYEVRNILMCDDLWKKGMELEAQMGISGQFCVCGEQRSAGSVRSFFAELLNAKLAACFVYSLVMAAWLFVALRYGQHVQMHTCAKWAAGAGGLFAILSYLLIRTLITPPRQRKVVAAASA
ncbi:MAG TPA: hypothetical protein VJ276_22540 [Thermoanaerobaculia bacterium]|nr:hypothetical protein [Thermoanaerobaculia bacterium]